MPLVTPLIDPRTLDQIGLDRLVEHVLAGGVHGIFLLGTTGEGPGLGRRLQQEMAEQACRKIAGWVPVLVGIADTSFADAVELAHCADAAGATTVVYAGPSYDPVAQAELLRHVARLAADSPLPLFSQTPSSSP